MDAQFATEPWFPDALEAAGLSPGRRALLLTAFGPEQTRAVLARIGTEGTLTVIEPDRYRAASLQGVEHPGLAVLGYRPDGDENFGVHDCVLAVPPIIDDWPLNHWGSIARHNLRPGGRLVLDLPHLRHAEAIAECLTEAGAPPHRTSRWNGVDDRGLARLLRADGLRGIETRMVTHVVRFPTTREAAIRVGALLDLDEDRIAGLHLALTRRFRASEGIELVFQRTRAVAMR